ncbi:MAG TPA: hypothetical protein VNT60_01130 [Deinococcales bacterium]|nr:hypothetical protein [Deinococcales bacterium]
MELVLPLLAAVLLAVVHFLAHRLRFLAGVPRSVWLSFAGGISVSYVFLHLLPELSEGQEVIAEAAGALGFLENHSFLLALLGLVVFYGLERAAREVRHEREDRPADAVFWLHVASFGFYNLLIGYLLAVREGGAERGLALFTLAMALHFLVNDYGLREHFRELYHRVGRWVLSLAVLAGWLLGVLVRLPEAASAVLVAFLAGGIVLNVLKEELPEERRSRYWSFLLGAGAYALLLLGL